jgi:hypothetical protein
MRYIFVDLIADTFVSADDVVLELHEFLGKSFNAGSQMKEKNVSTSVEIGKITLVCAIIALVVAVEFI